MIATKDELDWVSSTARLQELMEKYPAEWQCVGPALVAAVEDGRAETLQQYTARAKAAEDSWTQKIRRSRYNSRVIETAMPHLIKSRMSLLAVDRCYQAAALGKASGRIRFNRFNGYIIQKLLFSRHLTRKPASLPAFRFWWRFVTQKRLLMPLVQTKGIYCFYSRELLNAMSALIGDRFCLEIAAGDGTLSRFLADTGVRIQATDDYSWNRAVEYPESVEKLGARQALDKYQPQAVVCSWPPPRNSFEQRVFTTRSVEIYIVIGSRYEFASGSWHSYAAQDRFQWAVDPELSSMVIPPELESAVLVFRRK